MSQKITYLDIRRGLWSMLDIASMFPLSEAHPIRHARSGNLIDEIQQHRPHLDFSISKKLEIDRFSTLWTLDLALREIIDPKPWQQKVLGLTPRPHVIDLVPELDIPYGALDIRRYNQIVSRKKYPDIFARKLPYGLMMRRSSLEVRRWTHRHRRWIIGTLMTICCITVPVLFFVKSSVENGYEKFLSLRHTNNLSEVRSILSSARDDFERANFLFIPFSWIPSEKIDIAHRAIDGWRLLSRGMSDILDSLPESSGANFTFDRSETIQPEYRPVSRDIFPLESLWIETPTDWIEKNNKILNQAFVDMNQAGDIYANVPVDSDISKKMHEVWILLSRGMKYFRYGIEHQKELLQFFGHDEPVRYLVLNQNRDEIRANGGFPGSVIVFTLYKWNILDLRRDDVYYYDWNLYPYKEPPPPWLALLTSNYGLRDVNYYPDFRMTLDKANSFIERSGDSTITSWIAIHQWFIEEILEKTWPVTVSGVTIPFDANNFSLLMSTLVENQFAREHHPKDILFRFGDALLEKIQEKKLYGSIFDVMENSWKNGEILFASRDESMDRVISEFRQELPWECEVIHNEQVGVSSEFHTASCVPNWIYPVFTSVSGNKSDRYIVRTYEWKTTKLHECTYENKITISLKHTYGAVDTDKIRSYMDQIGIKDKKEREKLEFIEWNGKNRAFTRLYVPHGSTLAFTGADITLTQHDYADEYSFMLETNPWSVTSKTLRYTVDIPDCQNSETSLSWTRQPGIRKLDIR